MESPLYRQLAEKLADQIRQHNYKAGEKLPSVRSQAHKRDVSVSTIVMSYNLLEDWGMVEVRPKSGYYVKAGTQSVPELPKIRHSTATPKPVSSSQLVMDVMRDSSDPAYVSLGAAIPDSQFAIVTLLKKVFLNLVRTQSFIGTGCDSTLGDENLRRQLARRAVDAGVAISPDEIVITAGCQGAIGLCLRALCQPGDIVAVESPCYYGLLQLVESSGLKVLEIPSDPQTGISVEALRLALEQWPIKAVLTVPSFSNPMGALVPEPEKKRLVELINEYQLPLIEDDIYGDLGYSERRPKAIKAFDSEGRVLLCSSASKVLEPQLGLGWVMPGRYKDAIEYERFLTSTSYFCLPQMAVAEVLSKGSYDRHLRLARDTYRQRRDRLSDLIAQYFPPDTRMSQPQGGFVAWLQLPGGINAVQLYHDAKAQGVIIAPGAIFSSSQQKYRSSVRLSYANEWTREREQAIQIIGTLAHQQLHTS